jgi:hypothetical protein
MVLSSSVGVALGVKPFETFGKDSKEVAQEGGNTGRRADWPCHINIARDGEIAETVRSAPGRDPRMARFIRIFAGMARETRERLPCGLNFASRRGRRSGGLHDRRVFSLDLFVCITYK